jgi:hypothetical protein
MMNKIHLNVMLSLALTIVGNSAFAQAQGHDVGHGGNAVICGQSAPVVLDYYNATLGTMGGATPNLVDLTNLNSDQVVPDHFNQCSKFHASGFTEKS